MEASIYCRYCADFFNSDSDLFFHLKTQHNKKKKYSFCDICSFEIEETLEKHIKAHHPFTCFVCLETVKKEEAKSFFSFIHRQCCVPVEEKDFLKRAFDYFGNEMKKGEMFESSMFPGYVFMCKEEK